MSELALNKSRQFRTIEDTAEEAPPDAGSGWVVSNDCHHDVGFSLAVVCIFWNAYSTLAVFGLSSRN
jgi:hypothetical protein